MMKRRNKISVGSISNRNLRTDFQSIDFPSSLTDDQWI